MLTPPCPARKNTLQHCVLQQSSVYKGCAMDKDKLRKHMLIQFFQHMQAHQTIVFQNELPMKILSGRLQFVETRVTPHPTHRCAKHSYFTPLPVPKGSAMGDLRLQKRVLITKRLTRKGTGKPNISRHSSPQRINKNATRLNSSIRMFSK